MLEKPPTGSYKFNVALTIGPVSPVRGSNAKKLLNPVALVAPVLICPVR